MPPKKTDETLGYLVLHRIPAPRSVHGWVYEPIGSVCADLVAAENKWETAKKQHGDVVIAELKPFTLLRDRDPHRVIDPFAERDWARDLIANERKTPVVQLDRLAHVINLDKETA